MKKINKLLVSFSATLIILLSITNNLFAQTPDLGILSSFVLFSTNGAVTNQGTSDIIGNIGNSSAGYMGGFDTINVQGNLFSGINNITTQSSAALLSAYNQLSALTGTVLHVPTSFGNGETLDSGVYYKSMASTMDGVLTLDAQNNPNAIFIFKINGALSTSAGATMILINGASIDNVFFVVEGAMTFAANNILKGTFIANNGAIVCGAGTNITGRLLTTTGAITVNTFTGHLPDQSIINYWTGNAGTTNWFTRQNWMHNVPNGLSVTLVPNSIGTGNLYPIITGGTATVSSLVIESHASVVVNNGILRCFGDIDNAGIMDASKGTIENHDSVSIGLDAATFTSSTVQNLSLFYDMILLGKQTVTGTLKLNGSNITLDAGDLLTLKSTSAGTAQLGDLTNNGTQSGNQILGNVSVERYIPQKRAWRLLAAPISSGTGAVPTINAAWQEGETAANPNPNLLYGVQITGGTVANGFDIGVNTNPSLKYYDNSKNAFVGLPNVPGTNIPVTTYPGYFLFVRGDRSTQLAQGVAAAATPTTLRMKGKVNTGPIQLNINAANLTIIGNPYPSGINFSSIYANNSSVINNLFYAWDPQLGGTFGVGGYVTVSGNADGTYSVTPATTVLSQYIESGEAFLVTSANGNAGTITIKETDKASNVNYQEFKPLVIAAHQLSINLFGFQASDSSNFLIDGVLTDYGDKNKNTVDNKDAVKLNNLAENIGISRENKILSLERRHTIESNDTTFLKLTGLKNLQYDLLLTSNELDKTGLYGLLKDNYSEKNNNTLINLNGTTVVSFNVYSTAKASYASDRFSIVFGKLSSIPSTLINVTASAQQKDISVNFNTINQKDIIYYTIQLSPNGLDFITGKRIASVQSNTGLASYNWLDSNVIEGSHYYRIISTGITGKLSYSTVVKVNYDKTTLSQSIAVSPNIIRGNTITYKINNITTGIYALELYDMDGKLIKKQTVSHNGDNNTNYNFTLNNSMAAGKYLLQLSNKKLSVSANLIK